MPDEGKSSMVPVWDCPNGAAILERALKKLRGLDENAHAPQAEIIDGGITIDGWGVFMDYNSDGSQRMFQFYCDKMSLTLHF